MTEAPMSDLSRAISHEIDRTWPESMKIVATWPDGQTTEREIPMGAFFGLDTGAPMSGSLLIGMIEQLARRVPK